MIRLVLLLKNKNQSKRIIFKKNLFEYASCKQKVSVTFIIVD